jgi:phosphopantothenoylcysteine decarboxylase / phosphopantothenate---cysteine ligase
MLSGKKIVIGVTGSIAAYKSATLIRLLVKSGADVKVIMTDAAKDFIPALTLATLSKNEVLHALTDNNQWNNHVELGRWADLMLIAPLSCNTLAKMAEGRCDNLLMAVYLSATCQVAIAPAMDEDMWHHQSTKNNLDKVLSYGNLLIPVNHGELASGLIGEGRMAEPEEILAWLQEYFKVAQSMQGKKVLITAGPTYEAIDPVRFIGNHSTGKMGIALADACRMRGAEVQLIYGPGNQPLPKGIKVKRVVSAADMYEACLSVFPETDIAIMCAAVADYTIANASAIKIKKTEDEMRLELIKTKDILKTLGGLKKAGQLLVGFALETNDEEANAFKKLESKNADYIVLNSLRDTASGFGHDSNKITIFDRAGNKYHFDLKSKKEAAADIINILLNYSHA